MILWDSVTAEFIDFQDGEALLDEVGYGNFVDDVDPDFVVFGWNLHAHEAPGGGRSIVGGVPGDGDATGAIVVEVVSPPSTDDDWRGTEVAVTQPAYPAVGGLTRKTVVIGWED